MQYRVIAAVSIVCGILIIAALFFGRQVSGFLYYYAQQIKPVTRHEVLAPKFSDVAMVAMDRSLHLGGYKSICPTIPERSRDVLDATREGVTTHIYDNFDIQTADGCPHTFTERMDASVVFRSGMFYLTEWHMVRSRGKDIPETSQVHHYVNDPLGKFLTQPR